MLVLRAASEQSMDNSVPSSTASSFGLSDTGISFAQPVFSQQNMLASGLPCILHFVVSNQQQPVYDTLQPCNSGLRLLPCLSYPGLLGCVLLRGLSSFMRAYTHTVQLLTHVAEPTTDVSSADPRSWTQYKTLILIFWRCTAAFLCHPKKKK